MVYRTQNMVIIIPGFILALKEPSKKKVILLVLEIWDFKVNCIKWA